MPGNNLSTHPDEYAIGTIITLDSGEEQRSYMSCLRSSSMWRARFDPNPVPRLGADHLGPNGSLRNIDLIQQQQEATEESGQGLMWSEQSPGCLGAWGGRWPGGQPTGYGNPSATHLGSVGHFSVSSESPGLVSACTKVSLGTAPRSRGSEQS